jgi:exodeoxyribonuclease-3
MKITTWNVNGIRAALSKGMLDWFKENSPDILCLQEVKAKENQVDRELMEIPGYQVIWNAAERAGYSGVATFVKQEAEEITLGLDEERFDVEGRIIRTKVNGYNLFNVYFPNGQRDQERLEYKLEFYAKLLDLCDDMHAKGEKIIITGDFNTAHNEIDLANPKANEKNSGFMPIEREWIDKYLSHNFVDAFRVLYPEKVQYTWWTYRFGARQRNIGWRLDYYLLTSDLMGKVEDVIIHDDVMGSDHCPVTLMIK